MDDGNLFVTIYVARSVELWRYRIMLAFHVYLLFYILEREKPQVNLKLHTVTITFAAITYSRFDVEECMKRRGVTEMPVPMSLEYYRYHETKEAASNNPNYDY